MTGFKRIGLVGRPDHSGVVDSLQRLLTLLAAKELTVVLDDITAGLIDSSGQQVCKREELSSHCDLVIVVGGDGSMLNVAKYVAADQVPVIGINRGRLGFLTDISPDDLEARVEDVLSGKYSVESRFLLDVAIKRKDGLEILGCALNDVVLHPGRPRK